MLLKGFATIVCIVFLLFSPFVASTFASDTDIVLNEVLADSSGNENTDEFIEVFNKGGEAVIITNWTLSDTQGSTKIFTIPETTLEPGRFVVFTADTTKISLNNTGDGVVLKKADQTVIDQMVFDSSIEDKSWSRIPNGTGAFVNNAPKTSGAQNQTPPTISPSNTPTNSPAPTATKTPTPTKTPIPTKEPSKTNTPTPSSNKLTTSKLQEEDEDEEEVLGVKTTPADVTIHIPSSEKSEKESPTPSPLIKGESKINPFNIFIGVGFIFLSAVCGILLYRGYKKQKEQEL